MRSALSYLVVEELDKRFGDLHVLDRVSLAVAEGEVVALLGPSGSGKTTLLRLLAGFETPDGGAIRLAGDDVAGLPPARRRFGMVFQHYALFPHLTVGENVAFGLEAQRWPAERTTERVREVLALVDLAGFEGRRPGAISGGQQQRVALARALAPEPRVLLLDEPLSNLDPALRERTRRELRRAIERVGITTVLVTHEQEEAFDLGDRVAVLHRGRLEQVGRPEELYEAPATRFVAGFVGRASVLRGEADGPFGEGDPVEVRLGPRARWPAVAAFAAGEGAQPVEMAVRPEALAMRTEPLGDGDRGLAGEIVGRRYAGPMTLYRVALEAGGEVEVLAEERGLTRAAAAQEPLAVGARVQIAPRPDTAPPPRIFPSEAR